MLPLAALRGEQVVLNPGDETFALFQRGLWLVLGRHDPPLERIANADPGVAIFNGRLLVLVLVEGDARLRLVVHVAVAAELLEQRANLLLERVDRLWLLGGRRCMTKHKC